MTTDFSSRPTSPRQDDLTPVPATRRDRGSAKRDPRPTSGAGPAKIDRTPPPQPVAPRRSPRDRGDVTIPMPKPPKELQED